MIRDRTFWKAFYTDGESLLQFNSDNSENKYADIDRRRLIQFVLYRNEKLAVVIHLGGSKRLIYRMRRTMDNHGNEETVYLAGWQKTTNGRNVQMLMFFFEDSHIEIVDRFDEHHPLFYTVDFLKDERV